MKKELERILNGSAPLKFSEKNINWLIEHLEDPNCYHRDNLTYSLMAKGFLKNKS